MELSAAATSNALLVGCRDRCAPPPPSGLGRSSSRRIPFARAGINLARRLCGWGPILAKWNPGFHAILACCLAPAAGAAWLWQLSPPSDHHGAWAFKKKLNIIAPMLEANMLWRTTHRSPLPKAMRPAAHAMGGRGCRASQQQSKRNLDSSKKVPNQIRTVTSIHNVRLAHVMQPGQAALRHRLRAPADVANVADACARSVAIQPTSAGSP